MQNLQQIGADGGLRADRGPGVIPRPSNPFYVPTKNVANTPTTYIASTPPAQAQYVHRSPNLSPISLKSHQDSYLHHMSRDLIKYITLD